MKTIENWFRSSDGQTIFYHEFLPDNNDVKFVVQIMHGMAEHSERYTKFAEFLVNNGAAVYASDHRGHGRNAQNDDDYGVWPKKNTWCNIIGDLKILNEIAAKNYPNIPNFIFGHSMGSFLARAFIATYNIGLNGVILSGTGTNPTFLLKIGCIIASIQCAFTKITKRSKLLDNMSFGGFNKDFDGPMQWLSRDPKVIDDYIKDPRCGGVFTCSFYRSFFFGLANLNKKKSVRLIKKDLPLFFISGKNDPVGKYGKGVEEALEFYSIGGLTNLDIKLYDGARHEIINETNKKEVYQDILDWMNKHM